MDTSPTSVNVREDWGQDSTQHEWHHSHTSTYAPWYKVPNQLIVSVEHPFIIRNIEKGIASLGGPNRLQMLCQDSHVATARLYIKPEDRMSKPLKSANVSTNNVLLKITVPKRTGLKRRKGSQGPFHEGLEDNGDQGMAKKRLERGLATKDARYLIRTMRDNPISYEIHAIGTIEHTHRFRGMPDFVTSTASMPFMKKMQEHILPFDYEKMKGFTFDMSKGRKPNTEIIPPPAMTSLALSFNYSYRQNAHVKRMVDSAGNVSLINIQAQRKIVVLSLPFDAPEGDIPTAPASKIAPVDSLELPLQRLVASARGLLDERPIFTRRALINSLPGNDWDTIGPNSGKHIYQYCGYSFSAGPWRDAIIRFGVDPRKDASCRFYQTMMFMLDTQPKDNQSRWHHSMPDRRKTEQIVKKESHLFDGETVSKDGKVWQPCDVTDPLLKDLLATTNIRNECHVEADGWYHNGTWSKVKMIMKAKITAILTGMPQQHAAYARVAREMPDIIISTDKPLSRLSKDATPYEVSLASAIRTKSFDYRVPATERTPSQEEESDGEGEDGEVAMLDRSEEENEDPGIAEAALETDRLQGGAAQLEGIINGMEINDLQEASVQGSSDRQLQ